MSFNLIEAAKGLFTTDLLNKASAYLGENENSVTKAISGILPSVLGGLADKAGANEGANTVAALAQEQHVSGSLENLGDFFGNESGSLLNKGAGLLNGLFGETKLNALSSIIAHFSGAKSTSITSLLSMATPALLGYLGKHAAENNLNAGGLASLLSSQKENIAAALPAGLTLGGVFGSFSTATTPTPSAPKTVDAHASHHDDNAGETGGGDSALKWLLPLLLLALIAAGVLYFWRGCGKSESGEHGGHETEQHDGHDHGAAKPTEGATVAGKVDSLGNFVYDTGETITLTLPNNGGELKVGKNSTEAKLVAFLNDKNAAIDTVKGNWFEFTNVRFKKGSADLLEESMAQLKNLVSISKAYPTAVFKFGGYTDSTGSAAVNTALSQKRADAVMAMAKRLGATAASLAGGAKGYGPAHPICEANDTPECQAQNRRVAVNVKAK